MKSEKFNSKKTLLMGIYVLGYLIVLGFGAGILTKCIWGWITGDWGPLVGSLASFGITFTVSAAAGAVAGATTFGAAMAALATALWPWGWIILGGFLVGV